MANSSWTNPRFLPRAKKQISVDDIGRISLEPIIAIEGDVGGPAFRRILCIKTSRGTEDELLAETEEQLAVERTERLEQWSQSLTEKVEKLDGIVYRIWKDLKALVSDKHRHAEAGIRLVRFPPLRRAFGFSHPTAGIRRRKAYSFFRPFTCCLSLLLISSLFCSSCS